MKLNWLQDFLTLAEEANFSRAAERRHAAQPAFSRRIQALEDWIGAALVNRDSQPIRLTQAGRMLQPIAEDVVRQISQGRDRIRQSVASDKTLRFASTHTLSILFFPEWFHAIKGVPSGLGLSLQTNHMDTCAQALVHGECHFMLCFTNPDADLGFDQSRYASKVIGRDHLIPFAAPDDDGGPRFRLPGNRSLPIPHLVYSEPSAIGQMVEAMLQRRNGVAQLRRHSESPAAENLKSMAEDGLGLAWIASMRVRRDRQSSNTPVLLEAGDASWRIPLEIRLFRAMGELPEIAEIFWSLIGKAEDGCFSPNRPH